MLVVAPTAGADAASDLQAQVNVLQKQLDAVNARLNLATAAIKQTQQAEAQQKAPGRFGRSAVQFPLNPSSVPGRALPPQVWRYPVLANLGTEIS
jgi:hypothetical protein